jgi:hypothetical protein
MGQSLNSFMNLLSLSETKGLKLDMSSLVYFRYKFRQY